MQQVCKKISLDGVKTLLVRDGRLLIFCKLSRGLDNSFWKTSNHRSNQTPVSIALYEKKY